MPSVGLICGKVMISNHARGDGEGGGTHIVKYVSKVRGLLCDSRKSYIASVTIHPEGRQFHATDKICKKYRKLFIVVDTDSLWWSFLAIILIHIHQT